MNETTAAAPVRLTRADGSPIRVLVVDDTPAALGVVCDALRQQGVRVLSAGVDEVPAVYKDIMVVMGQQTDLVETIARFDPKIVKMADDGKSED